MEALIIIDVQNDYFKGGAMELVNADKVLEQIVKLQNKFQEENKEVIYIQHINKQGTFFLENTVGVALHSELLKYKKKTEKIFIKTEPNAFFETTLHQFLIEKNLKKVIIVGMMTHMCVDTTVRAAYDLGYEIIVCSDGVATKDLSFSNEVVAAHQVNLSYLSALQRFCNIYKIKEIFTHNYK